jgi:hypothetical protein
MVEFWHTSSQGLGRRLYCFSNWDKIWNAKWRLEGIDNLAKSPINNSGSINDSEKDF